MIVPCNNPILTFRYTNYKGNTGYRTVQVHGVYFGSTEYHPEPQWLMNAIDLDKKENRVYAMKDMTDVQTAVRKS